MEDFNVIVAIIFITLICLESILSAILHLDNYHRTDSLLNFIIGLLNAVLNIFFKGAALLAYHELPNYTSVKITNEWWSWLLLFILTDLLYYLFHVLGHRSMFFWASHVVHHSSEKFNLTTALRSGVSNTPFRFLFSAPLVLIGFSPEAVLLMDSLVLIYTFFLHTELIPKLGWIEFVLNTPSHHRVHHGSNPIYLDKNFGGVLIIWDKLFGTFQPELYKPIYGITKPIRSYNFFKVVFNEYLSLAHNVRTALDWKEKFFYTFGYPGWHPMPRKPQFENTLSILSHTITLMILSFMIYPSY